MCTLHSSTDYFWAEILFHALHRFSEHRTLVTEFSHGNNYNAPNVYQLQMWFGNSRCRFGAFQLKYIDLWIAFIYGFIHSYHAPAVAAKSLLPAAITREVERLEIIFQFPLFYGQNLYSGRIYSKLFPSIFVCIQCHRIITPKLSGSLPVYRTAVIPIKTFQVIDSMLKIHDVTMRR